MNFKIKFLIINLVIFSFCSSHKEAQITTWEEASSTFSLLNERIMYPLMESYAKFNCTYDKDYLKIIGSEIKIKKNKELIHKFSYLYCAINSASSIKGIIKREIYLRNQLIFSHFQEMEIKPGSWEITVSIKLPSAISLDVYKLKTTLRNGKSNLFTINTFELK